MRREAAPARAARDRVDVPIGAYQVSGEYSMLQPWTFCPGITLYAWLTGTLDLHASALWGSLAGFFLLMGIFRSLSLDAASNLGGWMGRRIFSRLPPDKIARANDPDEKRRLLTYA